MRSLYLVDVSSMFFRAFYAIRPLSNPQGLPTNAIYGFLSMTVKLMREVKPDAMAFCFDRPEPSFRKALDVRYKANRSDMPEDLIPQVPYVRKISEALGIPCFDLLGYEADDLIGSLSLQAQAKGYNVVIVSGDKDFAQLVRPGISIYDTMKDIRLDSEGIKQKFGINPDQMVDYLAITGDSSDNVPGVKGVGPKGAEKLLNDFGSLAGIYQNLDKIKSASLKQKLIDSKSEADISQKLVTIVCDLKLVEDFADLHMRSIDRNRLRDLLVELDFKGFILSLLGEGSGNSKPAMATTAIASQSSDSSSVSEVIAPTIANDENLIFSRKDVAQLATWLKPQAEVWAICSERGLALAQGSEVAELAGSPEELGPLLSEKNLLWKGFDLKEFWHRARVEKPKPLWDAKLATYLIKSGQGMSLAEMITLYRGRPLPELASWEQIVSSLMQTEDVLREKIKSIGCEKLLYELELPLAALLLKMERKGIAIDSSVLAQQSSELGKDAQVLEKEIHLLAGQSFNIGSPKQLAQILFEKLNLPSGKKTKTGFSTDNDVLEKISPLHPLPQKVLAWRELMKLKSTYVDALPQLADVNGRIHTTYNQALTATGRLSSINPNLQNIPIRTERGSRVRRAFISTPGKTLVAGDYSQIELRILAHVANDASLKKAFAEGVDVHSWTASEVFEVPLEAVTSDMRRKAKAVNFGLAYGQGIFGLAEALNIPRAEASIIIDRYFKRFSGVREYMHETVESAKKTGYALSIFGRRRYLDELFSKSGMVKKFGERAAINAPIQGSASDLIKMAMLRADQSVQGDMLLQVHDELIFECETERAQSIGIELKKQMEGIEALSVPLEVNLGYGLNWEDAHS